MAHYAKKGSVLKVYRTPLRGQICNLLCHLRGGICCSWIRQLGSYFYLLWWPWVPLQYAMGVTPQVKDNTKPVKLHNQVSCNSRLKLSLLKGMNKSVHVIKPRGGYSTLSWVRMCGPKFRTPPYNKTRENANLLPISKPFVSLRALFKTNQCFLQCKLGCISTFWQPVDKPKDKFIGNYAFCKNATYIKTNFQIKKGPLQNLRARKSTLSGPHIPVPTFPLSTPPRA